MAEDFYHQLSFRCNFCLYVDVKLIITLKVCVCLTSDTTLNVDPNVDVDTKQMLSTNGP